MVSPPTLWCFANVMGSGKFLFRDPTVAECVLSITARRELAQRLNTPYALDRLVAAEGPDDPLPLKAIRARPNGDATVAQLEAIFGWVGGTMASHYTRRGDKRRLAAQAIEKLANARATSIPAPLHPAGSKRKKQMKPMLFGGAVERNRTSTG